MPVAKVGPYDLGYAETGSGPAVVLLHSSAAGHRQWHKLMEERAGRNRMIAIDLFGYGATSPWPDEQPMTLADQASLAVTAANLDSGPVVIVGHSLGAAVACEAALQLGPRVHALAVFEPILFYLLKEHGEAEAYADIEMMSSGYFEHAKRGDWAAVGHHFIDYWAGAGAWAAMSDERKARILPMLPPIAHEWHALGLDGRPLAEWGTIAAPVHLLHAADTRLSTKRLAALLRKAHPHWKAHEFATGGHLAPIARPDLVNPVLAGILDEAKH